MNNSVLPDPSFVNPERYAAAIASFQGANVELSPKDVEMLAGNGLQSEMEDLVEYGLLTKNDRGSKTVYRPKDEYALDVSEEYKEYIFSEYSSIREFLSDDNPKFVENL